MLEKLGSLSLFPSSLFSRSEGSGFVLFACLLLSLLPTGTAEAEAPGVAERLAQNIAAEMAPTLPQLEGVCAPGFVGSLQGECLSVPNLPEDPTSCEEGTSPIPEGATVGSSVPPLHGGWPLQVQSTIPELDGSITAILRPVGGRVFGPHPVETSCGSWEMEGRVDPVSTQPYSAVSLLPGDFASVGPIAGPDGLEVRARIRFVRSDGRVVEIPLTVVVDLKGSWRLVPGPPGEADRLALALAELPTSESDPCWSLEPVDVGEPPSGFRSLKICESCEAPESDRISTWYEDQH